MVLNELPGVALATLDHAAIAQYKHCSIQFVGFHD